jgi:hypothetical protein
MAARQELATVCIPVIGGLTVWTFPVTEAQGEQGASPRPGDGRALAGCL